MDENKIRAWGYLANRILLGVAAIIGACKAPQAISDYAVNVKTEQIVSNTISSVTKIVSNIKNENTNTIINHYREKLQHSLDDPDELKKEVLAVPVHVLKELGLKTSKAELSFELKDARTPGEVKKVLNERLPDVLLDSEGKPFVLDNSKLGP